MFRTVFPSIIRSSRLYIQQQAYVKQLLLASGNEMDLVPASEQTQYLFDKCLLLYYSLELLMMHRNTVRNMKSITPK